MMSSRDGIIINIIIIIISIINCYQYCDINVHMMSAVMVKTYNGLTLSNYSVIVLLIQMSAPCFNEIALVLNSLSGISSFGAFHGIEVKITAFSIIVIHFVVSPH